MMTVNPFGAGLFADFYNVNDSRAASGLVADRVDDRFVDHTPAFGAAPNKDGFANTVAFVNSAFRQEYQVDRIVEQGSIVVGIWHADVTHVGQFLHVAPTGGNFRLNGITAYELIDGRVVAHWEQFDILAILITLGIVPPLGG